MDIQHFFPHIARSSFAEFHFALNAGLQRLDVVEDQWESEEARGHSDGAENHGDECD
jgi:hypothetical protein